MKVKKNMLTKVIAVFAIVAMMLSMSMTAFAISGSDKGDFTVSGLDTTVAPQVTAYQIITVNIDDASGQPAYPMYTWKSEVAAWLKTNGYSKYVDDQLGANAVADVFEDISADDETVFLEELTAAIKGGTVAVAASKTVDATRGSAAFTNMDMGVYLITANGGVKIYQPTTVELVPAYDEDTQAWVLSDATAAMKFNDPLITKTVDDPQVAIGDTVTYTIEADVPDYPKNAAYTSFIVSDKLDAGLTFDGIDTIKVYSDADKQNVVPASNNYNITTENINDRTFQISFQDDFTTTTTADTLYITYTATVNTNAFGTDVLGNDAYLTYNNDPYTTATHEMTDDVNVYTYGITVNKVDKNDAPLADAKFKVEKGGAALKFSGTNGIYIPDATNGTEEVEVSANGVLQLQGLDVGTYVLTETEAPSGYVLPTGTITVVITDDESDGKIAAADVTNGSTAKVDGIAVSGTNQNVISFNLENINNDDAGFTLPVTGGMGTMIFTILGIALMAGAVTIIVVSRKKKA